MPVQPSLSAALSHRMDFLVARQGIVAGNVANAATPGYLAKDIQFKKMYDSAGTSSMGMAATNGKHIRPKGMDKAGKVETSNKHITLNGNSVKLDEEMLKLSEIQMNYQLATRLYNKHAQMQRIAIGRQQ